MNTNINFQKSINKDKNTNNKESINIFNQKSQKNINSNLNDFRTKSNEINKIENRLPWGWGGNTSKNIDSAKKITYDIESNTYRNEQDKKLKENKSKKKIKDKNNNTEKKSRNIEEEDIKRKRGMSSYATFSGFNKNKEEQKNINFNSKI